MTELCDAAAFGYTCDRENGHGALHHDPTSGVLDQNWWIWQPVNEKQRLGEERMSGYRLISDDLLTDAAAYHGRWQQAHRVGEVGSQYAVVYECMCGCGEMWQPRNELEVERLEESKEESRARHPSTTGESP